MRVWRSIRAVAFVVVLSLASAGPVWAASGGSSGVHIDPGSPAGKQYAIPIPSARGETSGQGSGTSSANPPIFGVGVTPAASASGVSVQPGGTRQTSSSDGTVHGGSAINGRRANATAGAGDGQGHHGRGSSSTAVSGAAAHPAASASSVGGTSWLPLLGGGVLVLLLGGGGGYLVRRRL